MPARHLRPSPGDRALVFGLYVLGTLMTALAVHLASVLVIPRRADHDAYARVSALVEGRALRAVVAPAAPTMFPGSDPAVTSAFCLYDLATGPVRVEIDVRDADFVALSLHGRYGRTFYGLTSRSASGGRIALVLRTPRQADEAASREESDAPSSDLGVVLPEPRGFARVQVLSPEPSAADEARRVAGRLSCASAAGR